jgi:hypothetical protein
MERSGKSKTDHSLLPICSQSQSEDAATISRSEARELQDVQLRKAWRITTLNTA